MHHCVHPQHDALHRGAGEDKDALVRVVLVVFVAELEVASGLSSHLSDHHATLANHGPLRTAGNQHPHQELSVGASVGRIRIQPGLGGILLLCRLGNFRGQRIYGQLQRLGSSIY